MMDDSVRPKHSELSFTQSCIPMILKANFLSEILS